MTVDTVNLNGKIKAMEQVIEEIRRRAYLDFKNQSEYAAHLGVSRALLSAVINGKKRPTKAILDDIGYSVEKVYIYTKK